MKNLRLSLVFLRCLFTGAPPVKTWGQWLVWPIGVFEFTPGYLGCGVFFFLCDTARKGWVKLILQGVKKNWKNPADQLATNSFNMNFEIWSINIMSSINQKKAKTMHLASQSMEILGVTLLLGLDDQWGINSSSETRGLRPVMFKVLWPVLVNDWLLARYKWTRYKGQI